MVHASTESQTTLTEVCTWKDCVCRLVFEVTKEVTALVPCYLVPPSTAQLRELVMGIPTEVAN